MTIPAPIVHLHLKLNVRSGDELARRTLWSVERQTFVKIESLSTPVLSPNEVSSIPIECRMLR